MRRLKAGLPLLIVLGLTSTVVYACLAPFLWRYDYHQPDNISSYPATLALCVLLACVVYAQRKFSSFRHVSIFWIVLFPVLFVGFMVFSRPNGDVFDYINMGWLQARYHLNPYASSVADVEGWQQDAMFKTTNFVARPAVYGFAFTALMKWVTMAAHGNWNVAYGLYRAVLTLAFLATAWLLWTAQRSTDIASAKLAVFSFLWNPLLLIFHIGYGHNDLIMAVFSVWALVCLMRGRLFWVFPLLTLAVLVKFAAVLSVLPVFIFLVQRCDRKTLVSSLLASLGIVVVMGLPYLTGAVHFEGGMISSDLFSPRASVMTLVTGSWASLGSLYPVFARWDETVRTATFAAFYLGFAIFYGARCLRLARVDRSALTTSEVVESVVLFHFVLICFVHSNFYTWYFGMFLGLALLLPASARVRRLVVATSCVQAFALTGIGDFFNQDLNAALKIVPLLLLSVVPDRDGTPRL